MAGMQKDSHLWSGPEAKAGIRRRDLRLDGCYENRRQTDELKERRAPNSKRKKAERNQEISIAHFSNV